MTSPGIPRSYTQARVASELSAFMVYRDGIIMRGPDLDWSQADKDIEARFGTRAVKRIRVKARREAAQRLGVL